MGLKESWEKLLAFYRGAHQPGLEYQLKWKQVGERYDIEAVEKAVDHCIEHMQAIPSMSQWIATVDSIQENINRVRKEKERKEAQQFFSGEKLDDYGKKAVRNINGLLSGQITRRQFVDTAEALGMNMRPTKQYYQNHGLDLDKVAGE